MQIDKLAQMHGRSGVGEQSQEHGFRRQSERRDALQSSAAGDLNRNAGQRHSHNVRHDGAKRSQQVRPVLPAQVDAEVHAVAAHVGGENFKQRDITDRVDVSANTGETERDGKLSARTEFGIVTHNRLSAILAAL